MSLQAALTNQLDVVEYLLSQYKTAVSLGLAKNNPPTDLLGITPIDVARATGNLELADKLNEHYYGRTVTSHRGGDQYWHKQQYDQKQQRYEDQRHNGQNNVTDDLNSLQLEST